MSGYMKDVNAKIADWERNFHAWYPENQMGQADHARMMARELTSIYDALNDVREKLFEVADEFSAYNSNTNTSTVPNRNKNRNTRKVGGRSRKTRSRSA